MPLSGGVFTRLYSWAADKAAGVKIRSDKMDAEFDGIATALSTALYKDGQSTPTANIPMGGFKITGLGTPTNAADAARKDYVDAAAAQFENFTVRLATTANITIATGLNVGETIDSVTLVDGDLVLVKSQSTASQNGIYVAGASPARSTSFDTWDEHIGAIINVTAGTVNAGISYRCTVNAGGTLDTTDITFVQFGSSLTLPVPISSGGTGASSENAAIAALVGGATAETAVATDDYLPILDTSGSVGRKMTTANVVKAAAGQQTIWVPAIAMTPRTTNGAAAGSFETSTNDVMLSYLAFDATTKEGAQFGIQMPKSWNGGTLIAQFVWTHPATTTNFGVSWELAAVALANDGALDASFGTLQEIDDTGGTTYDLYISDETPEITVAGSPAGEQYVIFQVTRDPADTGDTLAVDAWLLGVKIHYTTSNTKDD